MLLCAQGLCRTILKNSRGWNLFAGLPYRFNTFHAKSSNALTHFTGLLFFRIFPEAFLLTRKLRHNTILCVNLNSQRTLRPPDMAAQGPVPETCGDEKKL